ncbi:MAG: enzyme of heme biosynthesis [Alistipes sp.]
MKRMKLLLGALLMLVGVSALAQDLSDPKYADWGDTQEERKANILHSSFFKEELQNKNYNSAAGYYKQLIDKVPAASEAIYQRASILFGNKFRLAKTVEAQQEAFDSLMMAYDLRLKYFGTTPEDKAAILDRKAREFSTYRISDREGLRAIYKEAIQADIEGENADLYETALTYYAALVDDFKSNLVSSDELIAEYERLTPVFDTAPAEMDSFKSQFEGLFGGSGVASCEILEPLFKKKLEAAPNDEKILEQAVALMSRAKCNSDFFVQTTEKYYTVKPSSKTAMFLAGAFQSKGDHTKSLKYLREALNVETDPAAKEDLYIQIGVNELAANRPTAAIEAVRAARALNPENGMVYLVLAQGYAATAGGCSGLSRQAVYWVAYDTMAQAASLLAADKNPDKRSMAAVAQRSMAVYRRNWPTAQECFFQELSGSYTVTCGAAAGITTTVRPQ